jgi:hypothetical protein
MKRAKVFGACVVSLIVFAANTASAAWVGAFLYRGLLYDHIHITVADAGKFDNATELNIWNNVPSINMPMSEELSSASQWILFWDNKPKEEIIDAWTKYYGTMVKQDPKTGVVIDSRSLTDHNCAFSAEYLLENILDRPLKTEWTWSRVFLFIWVPKHHGRIPLAGHALTRLRDTLKAEHRPYYTHHDSKTRHNPAAFLASLHVPSETRR